MSTFKDGKGVTTSITGNESQGHVTEMDKSVYSAGLYKAEFRAVKSETVRFTNQ